MRAAKKKAAGKQTDLLGLPVTAVDFDRARKLIPDGWDVEPATCEYGTPGFRILGPDGQRYENVIYAGGLDNIATHVAGAAVAFELGKDVFNFYEWRTALGSEAE